MERVGCFFLAILAFQHGNLDGKYRGDKLKWKLFDSQSAPNHKFTITFLNEAESS